MTLKLSKRTSHKALVFYVSLLGLLGLLGPAHGSPFLEALQFGALDKPFGARSLNAGITGAYFHPARIPLDRLRVSTALVSLYQFHSISFDERPSGYDIADSVYRSRSVNGAANIERIRPLATGELPYARRRNDSVTDRAETLVVGLSAPLIQNRLGVSMVATLPVGLLQTQRPFFVDERSQFFDGRLYPELYGDRLESSTVALAAAYRLGSWVSLGAGVTLSNNSSSVPQVYVPDAGDQERTLTNAQVEVTPTLAPFGSINVRPLGNSPMSLSLTIHGASQSRLKGRGELRFWEFEYPEGQTFLKQTFDLVFQYQPLRLGLGMDGVVDLGPGSISVYGDLVWSDWSSYRNRHGDAAAGWVNTVDVKGGLSYQTDADSFGLGAAYFPTPVPSQSGRTNYVDSARVAAQVGWLRRFRLEEKSISLGLGLQFQHLLQRRHEKSPESKNPVVDEFPDARDLQTGEANPDSIGLQTNNPGFPGYRHQGRLLIAMLQLGLEL